MTSTAPSRTTAAPSRRDAVLLWSAIAVTVLLWASAFVGIRFAADDFGPGALTLGRIVVGSIALTVVRLVITARRRGDRPERSRVPRGRILLLVLVWGVAWFGVYNLALNAAERHVDAGTAALLVNIAPMITAVLAGLLLGEGFPRRLLGGMAVALAGVAVIAFSTSSGQFDVIGVVLGLAAAVLYGSAATLQKRLLGHVDAMTMTWIGCLAATVACLPFAPELVASLQAAPTSSIAAVVYLGVFPTAVAFTTWGYVLSRSSAGRTAATTYAVPAVVVLLSWLLLAETPPAAALIGGAIALAGVAVATLRRRPAGV
ncbi:threonine/homoserine efflux transporter RhtA [Rathayibacter sp. PhB93]|uniref:DMT family transporter n=1 Tax=unclassified Rathayibacter TaxID=2609250 RepID=UPI000F474708|nr:MULTISPECIES: DMT family transporter [unclassified Rathayibacter]ROQ15775.1 threonine/homoserine efflux transporter RhtA [Rathayibacter sp. PhB93]TDQ15714.1 threonine/homoserine efflux transporter RhtA [Rathayibacter sp. PhB1]